MLKPAWPTSDPGPADVLVKCQVLCPLFGEPGHLKARRDWGYQTRANLEHDFFVLCLHGTCLAWLVVSRCFFSASCAHLGGPRLTPVPGGLSVSLTSGSLTDPHCPTDSPGPCLGSPPWPLFIIKPWDGIWTHALQESKRVLGKQKGDPSRPGSPEQSHTSPGSIWPFETCEHSHPGP